MPTVNSVVDELICELTSIALDNNELSRLHSTDFVVAVELNLDVTGDGSLTPSFTYNNGVFSFGTGAKLDVSRDQNFSEQLFFSLLKLREYAQHYDPSVGSKICGDHADTPLAGDLGLRETAHMAIMTDHIDFGQQPGSAKGGAFGGYVKFVIVKNLNAVGPTWTIKHFKGPGGLLGLTETNTDQVFFAFAERKGSASPKEMPREAATVDQRPATSGARSLRSLVSLQPEGEAEIRAQQLLQDLRLNQLSSVLSQIQVNTR